MMATLLPLHFSNLSHIQYADIIRESVRSCIEKEQALVIAITCDEVKQHVEKLDVIWSKMQQFLSAVYVIQLTEAYKHDEPLFKCNVIFQDVCGYPVHLEPYIHTVHVFEDNKDNIQVWNQSRNLPEHRLESTTSKDITLKHIKDQKDPHIFQRVAVGGTFDHIHAGHEILLTMTALLASNSVVVGVTDDVMLAKKKHRELINPISERIQQVKAYLNNAKRGLVYDVVAITDPYGPTITDPTIDALVVSKETLQGGHMVNDKRKERDFSILEIRIIDVISSNNASVEQEDMGALKISSSWIRNYLAQK